MGGPGGVYCVYRNCKNNSRTYKGSFFRFPRDRARTWAYACGRLDLLKKKDIGNCRLCGNHFLKTMFLNDLRNRLHTHAVPTQYKPDVAASTYIENLSDIGINKNGIDYNGSLCEVKPEPTEIVYLTEPPYALQAAKRAKYVENASDPMTEDFFAKHAITSDPNNQYFASTRAEGEARNNESTETTHECDVCTRRFKTKSEAVEHAKLHTDMRSHKYDVDANLFKTRDGVTKHATSHSIKKKHECNLCAKHFKTHNQILMHMKRHTDECKHKCDICLKTLNDVLKHSSCLTDEKNHKCEVYNKGFKTRNNVVEHVKSHADDKSYKCGICTKSFKSRRIVAKHMKSHSDDGKHKCDVCDKHFKSTENIVTHRKGHLEEWFECDKCGTVFTSENVLEDHIGDCDTFEDVEKSVQIEQSVVEECNQNVLGNHMHCKMFEDESIVVCEECKVYIKEESLDYIEAVVANDLLESSPSRTRNETHLHIIEDEKPMATEMFNLFQTFNSEIVIKEEEIMTSTTTLIDKHITLPNDGLKRDIY